MKTQDRINQIHPVKLSCDALWKVFGNDADTLKSDPEWLAMSRDERSETLRENGYIVGAEDISFSVHAGELFVIMGLSGSGKSTVLRCIAQLQKPSFGHVFLDGECLDTMAEPALRDIRRRKMGMVFQNFGLIPHFTALQNIAFPLKVRGESKADANRTALAMLNLVGLDGRGDAYPSELSGGMQQRVGIARSLAVDPELWLLDEPFSALDPLIRRQLQDELIALQARLKKSIIFVTHDFSEAVRLADRIAIMRDGKMVQLGRPADLLLNPADDYVARFVGDVSRLQVLRLDDIMTPDSKIPSGFDKAIHLDSQMTLEQCLVDLDPKQNKFVITDEAGKPIGHCTRADLLRIVSEGASP
jgi:glycine betaine/proline transport system ATP-binding protein